jgi:hypothetical protein
MVPPTVSSSFSMKEGLVFNQPLWVSGQNEECPFLHLYSCVAPLSGESFTLFLPEVNTGMMNIFFDELSKEYPDKEIIIALDQAGWHKAKDLNLPNTISSCFFLHIHRN